MVRREILTGQGPGESWAAIVEDGRVAEVWFESAGPEPAAGDIFSGLVRRVMPGMQAAFVDIGTDRAAFVHAADVPAVLGPEAPRVEGRRRIADLLTEGQRVLVQITKEPVRAKGARATLHVSLPGRLLVAVPTWKQTALSRRIEDEATRERLLGWMQRIARFEEGWIVRTAAAEATEEELAAEAATLRKEWATVARAGQNRKPPVLLRRDEDVFGRLLRDLAGDGLDAVVADGPAAFERARERIAALAPAVLPKLRCFEGHEGTLMERRGVRAALEGALQPRIRLASGATIVISQTEALVAVDVNTARFTGAATQEETALETDLEAAREIARQIRLRNLGGIIVIDFIDLERETSRARVVEALAAGLAGDRVPSRILGMSSFGLVQLTRRRGRLALDRALLDDCPCCRGTGRLKSARLIAHDVRAAIASRPEAGEAGWIVRLHPSLAARFAGERAADLAGPEAGPVRVEPDPEMGPHRFAIARAETL